MEHTALPWEWVLASEGLHFKIQTVNTPTALNTKQPIGLVWAGLMPSEEYQANAEFIVRACNSHAELIEALRAIVDSTECGCRKGWEGYLCPACAGEQALAKATKEG